MEIMVDPPLTVLGEPPGGILYWQREMRGKGYNYAAVRQAGRDSWWRSTDRVRRNLRTWPELRADLLDSRGRVVVIDATEALHQSRPEPPPQSLVVWEAELLVSGSEAHLGLHVPGRGWYTTLAHDRDVLSWHELISMLDPQRPIWRATHGQRLVLPQGARW